MRFPIWCAPFFHIFGRHNEAVLHAAKSVELDPLDLMTNYRLLQANYYARRYDEAVRTGRIAIELTPDSPYTCFYLALSLTALGLRDEAWSIANMGEKLNDKLPLGEGYFGYLAGVLGHTIEARGVLGDLQARRDRGLHPCFADCLDLSWLGETGACVQRSRSSAC